MNGLSDALADNRELSPCPIGNVVGILEHKDRLFVATQSGVYELIQGIWTRMAFSEEPITIVRE